MSNNLYDNFETLSNSESVQGTILIDTLPDCQNICLTSKPCDGHLKIIFKDESHDIYGYIKRNGQII